MRSMQRSSTASWLVPGRGSSADDALAAQQRERELNAYRLSTMSKSWQLKRGASILLKRPPENDQPAEEQRKEKLGHWSSPLWRCRDDWGTCCIVCWCSCVVASQLYEREIGPPGACRKWFFRLGLICTINAVLVLARNAWVTATFDSWPAGSWETYSYLPDVTVGGASTLLACTTFVIVVKLLRAVRRKLRREDDIPAGRCGEYADDCCVAFWCTLCLECQLLRHLGLTWGRPICCADEAARRRRRYTLRTTTGEPSAAVVDAVDAAPGAAEEELASPV